MMWYSDRNRVCGGCPKRVCCRSGHFTATSRLSGLGSGSTISRAQRGHSAFERGKGDAALCAVGRTSRKRIENMTIQGVQLGFAAAGQFEVGDEIHRFLHLLEAPTAEAFPARGSQSWLWERWSGGRHGF